jgi:hypothetical protein
VAAARHPADSDIALWALHSLTIMAQSTGPGYMQHVHSTFTLCRELLVGDCAGVVHCFCLPVFVLTLRKASCIVYVCLSLC